MERPSKPIASSETVANTAEQGRKVPLGYDSISPRMWLSSVDRTQTQHHKLEDLPEYKNNDWYYNSEKVIPEANIVREKNGQKNFQFFFKPFEKMRVATSKILTKTDFASRVERGDYAIILGEDTSGRIPTLFLSELVKGLMRRGTGMPVTNFYAGHRSKKTPSEYFKDITSKGVISSNNDIKEYEGKYATNEAQRVEYKKKVTVYLEGLKNRYLSGENEGKKFLICTETISTAGSIKSIVEVLKELGCGADVFTFAGGEKYTPPPDVTVFSGITYDPNVFDDSIEKNYMMSGVWKKDWDIQSTPIQSTDKEVKTKLLDEPYMKIMREDTNIETKEAMRVSRYMAKYVSANVAQAYLDYKAGRFELFKEPIENPV